VISSSQRTLPDNTQPSQQTSIHAPGGIRTRNLSRPQTYPLVRAATGSGIISRIPATNYITHVSIVKPTRCINVSNLFYWSSILHVSDDLSVHHQELKTVRTVTGICQTVTDDCASRQQCLFDICLLQYVQSLTPDDGRKDRPKHVELYSNKINLRR